MNLIFKKSTYAFLSLLMVGLLFSVVAIGQPTSPINVNGSVTDSSGEPIIGANILIKDTSSGTVTDFDGNFVIEAPGNGVLTISYIGYLTQEVAIQNRRTIQVTLIEDTELLDELVVIGYGTVRKDDATGSVTAVDATKLNRGLATSPSDLLAGKVAGMSIVSSGGAPGSGSSIRIRGGSSMSASNDPLIVIDGVPVDNATGVSGMSDPLSTINSNDIETFTVLKDASATAITGGESIIT